jgi:hypothetical protein
LIVRESTRTRGGLDNPARRNALGTLFSIQRKWRELISNNSVENWSWLE